MDGLRALYPLVLAREAKALPPAKRAATTSKFFATIEQSTAEHQRRVLLDLRARLKLPTASSCGDAKSESPQTEEENELGYDPHSILALYNQVLADNPDEEQLKRINDRQKIRRWTPVSGAQQFVAV
jgi:hypothetical protein